jgi:flagellar biosynthesis/type III secretory pathway protein FliH
MIDMQRWGLEYERGEWDIAPDPEGQYVLLVDAQAAIRAAVEVVSERRVAAVGDIAKQVAEASERGRSKGYEEGYWTGAKSGYANGHKDGQRDMLAKCIAAVEALDYPHIGSSSVVQVDQVINILLDLKKGLDNVV